MYTQNIYCRNIIHKVFLLFSFCLFLSSCHPFFTSEELVEDKQILVEKHSPTAVSTEMVSDLPAIIGRSVEGRPIEVVRFGNGSNNIILVGGIHGGYEANTVALLHQMIEKLQKNPEAIPPTISVYIIPTMNPDGQEKARMAGRVNANAVDLNRNWGCDWIKNQGYYYGQYYHTGSQEFSEPETQHVLRFILSIEPSVVIFYHSRGSFIFYGECGTLVDSRKLAEFASNATGYPVYNPTNSFGDEETTPITGDATNYLDSIGIRAIGIELSSHDGVDLERNYNGLLSIFSFMDALEEP